MDPLPIDPSIKTDSFWDLWSPFNNYASYRRFSMPTIDLKRYRKVHNRDPPLRYIREYERPCSTMCNLIGISSGSIGFLFGYPISSMIYGSARVARQLRTANFLSTLTFGAASYWIAYFSLPQCAPHNVIHSQKARYYGERILANFGHNPDKQFSQKLLLPLETPDSESTTTK